jgi:hypothetical protein
VVVAVLVVRVMQVAGDHVVDVIAVLNCLVAAIRAVLVVAFVLGAVVVRRAIGRVCLADRDLAHGLLAPHLILRSAVSKSFGPTA